MTSQNRRFSSAIALGFMILSWMMLANASQAVGIYAYVDMRGEKDATAKIVEFSSARRSCKGYLLRYTTGVTTSKYHGVICYPKLNSRGTVAELKKQVASLEAFAQRFPEESRYRKIKK